MAARLETPPAPAAACDPGFKGRDRRRSRREQHLTTATLQPASGDSSVERQVIVRDLSLGGVGFRSNSRFKTNTIYRITVGTGPLFLNAKLRIVSCRPRRDGTFDIGGEFC